MRRLFRYGGVAASIVLIAFGTGSIYMGIDGRNTVRSELAREQIVGTRRQVAWPGCGVYRLAEGAGFERIHLECHIDVEPARSGAPSASTRSGTRCKIRGCRASVRRSPPC